MALQYFTDLSIPQPGHTTGGSGRGARRNGRAGSGRISCQQICSPRKHKSRVPSKGSQKRRLSVSPEARTNEILCKHLSNPKPEHTTGRSGRTAHGGAARGAGLDRTDAVGSIRPGDNPFLMPFSESKTLSWTTLRKHEQTKCYVKRRRNEISG